MEKEINPKMEDVNFILKKKWTLCILTELHLGSKHFHDFNRNLPNLSTKVLDQSLRELEGIGLISKIIIQEKPKSTEYSLTEKGKLSKSLIKEYYGFISEVSSGSDEEMEILKRIEGL